eukprot:2460252-Prymnesium_polylepis.1
MEKLEGNASRRVLWLNDVCVPQRRFWRRIHDLDLDASQAHAARGHTPDVRGEASTLLAARTSWPSTQGGRQPEVISNCGTGPVVHNFLAPLQQCRTDAERHSAAARRILARRLTGIVIEHRHRRDDVHVGTLDSAPTKGSGHAPSSSSFHVQFF